MKSSSPSVFHVEEEPGAEVLIVAFTGVAAKFNAIHPFDFFQLTGLLRYHRILVREPWHFCYLKGIDEKGLEGLVERLQNEIRRLAPKRVVFIGVSSGGYASLLLGHIMRPDYVHAFSPYTYLDFINLVKDGSYRSPQLRWLLTMIRINLLSPKLRRYLDLQRMLMEHNGKTRFYLHACARNLDRVRAQHMEGCAHTQIFLYPCDNHNVTWGMLKSKCLIELLRTENLDNAEAIYRQFYADFNPDDPVRNGCCKSHKEERASIVKK